MKTVQKSKIKEGYYWEYESLYDSLPKTLTVPEYKTEIFEKPITNKKIIEKYKIVPYTIEQAFAVAIDCIPTLKNNYKGRIIYFKNGDTLCGLYVYCFDDGLLGAGVDELGLDGEWDAGNGTIFSNTLNTLDSSPLDSESLMTLETAIQMCKDAGLEVVRLTTVREVL